MTTVSVGGSGLHSHHSLHSGDLEMLDAISSMPIIRQNGHPFASSSNTPHPPTRKRHLDTLHALRRPPIDPIVLAATLSSGPHVTRHHFHHSFGPKVESKQMSRSQRERQRKAEEDEEQEKRQSEAKSHRMGRHRAGSYANCDRDEIHDIPRKMQSGAPQISPKVELEQTAYFSKQGPRSERLKREQEAKGNAALKSPSKQQSLIRPETNGQASAQIDQKLQNHHDMVKSKRDAQTSLSTLPDNMQSSSKTDLPTSSALSSIVRPPPVHVRCYVRTRIPTPHGEVFCHLYRNNRDNKEHLALVVDTAQNAIGKPWEDADQIRSSQSKSIRSKTLDEVWGPHETDMERIVRGAYVGRLGPSYQIASKAREQVKNPMEKGKPLEAPLVRIHSECYTGETIGSQRCDCGEQLDEAIRLIHADSQPARGVVVYLRQEGRGIGLLDKLMAYNLQDMGHDTVSANILLGHLADARKYDVAAEILRDLDLSSCRLLTNNPEKMEALEIEGIKVERRVPMVPRVWRHGALHRRIHKKPKSKSRRRVRGLEESIVSQMDDGIHQPSTDLEDLSDDGSDASRESYVDHILRRSGATLVGGSMTHGPELEKYLRTKVERMGHLLDVPPEKSSPSFGGSSWAEIETEDEQDQGDAPLTDEEIIMNEEDLQLDQNVDDDDEEEILIRAS